MPPLCGLRTLLKGVCVAGKSDAEGLARARDTGIENKTIETFLSFNKLGGS